MERASDQTVELVWNDLLGADRLHRYYGYLTQRLERINSMAMVTASFCSGGAFFVFLSGMGPPWSNLIGFLMLVTVALNVWLAARNRSRMVAYSADMQRQLARLLGEWEELWADVYVRDDGTVRERWRELQRRTTAVTERASSRVPLVKSLAIKSEREAYSYRSLRYASS